MRWLLRVAVAVLALAGAKTLWQLYHRWQPRTIRSSRAGAAAPDAAADALEPADATARSGRRPTRSGSTLFARAAWVYPLPGPVRRAPVDDAPASSGRRRRAPPAACRPSGHCGVDLGGELWGEHVYAAHDGVVDHVQRERRRRAGRRLRAPGALRRLWCSPSTFTWRRFRAPPRGIAVKAGEVIGLVGDTGSGHRRGT